jgi:hypothetical protein
VAWDPAGSDIVGLRGLDALPGQPLLELDVPPCGAFLDAARVCGRLLVASWTVTDPDAVLPLDNGASQTVAATTLPGVADAWLRAFGPGFREDVLLDGANAVLVQSSRQAPLRLAVIAEHGGRFWLIQTESGAFQPTITHSRFVQLLGSWQWLAANFPFSVRLLTYPATPGRPAFTARSDQTKGYLPPGGDVTTIGLRDSRVCPGASGFAAAICQLEGGGELASTVTVSVDHATFADAVASLPDGYSLVYSRLGDDSCVLALPAPGAVRDPIALVLHGTTVWRIVGHDLASPGTGWDLERFLLGFTPQG